MSFILEALKKSDQQRQQNTTTPKKVGTRRLSLTPHHSPHRPYWLVIAGLLLLIFGGCWFFSASRSEQGQPLVDEHVESPPPADNPINPPKPAVIVEPDNIPKRMESETGVAEQALRPPADPALLPSPVVETAPVPRTFLRPASSGTKAPSSVTVQTEPMVMETLSPHKESPTLPLYTELSVELRERMPRLDISMHFYTPAPQRRLVRINNRLLREGDWVSGEVEIIHITPTGVILDFLGKDFKLSSEN